MSNFRYDFLIKKYFDKRKCFVLKDPIIDVSSLTNLKNEKLDENLINKKYILNIGRLVKQKNQFF